MTGQLRSGLNSAGSVLTSMTSSWANLGGAVTAVQGAFGLFSGAARTASGFIGELVMAASDLDESMNLVRVQFGSGAPEVEKAAQDMADRFGIVKSEFLQGAGSIGVVVEAMGQGSEATARMSVDLVKLAGDLSSIRNLRFQDVLVGLRAGLGGESEPLKNLGVFINEAAVKAEAYRSGIAKIGVELTDAQKIQARYNLILAQTGKAQGDLERTADGVANSSRAVMGRLENLKADLGSAFTTVSQVMLASVGGAITNVAAKFGDVRASVKAWADASVQYGGVVNQAVGLVGEAVASIVDAWVSVRAAWVSAQSAMSTGLAGLVRFVEAFFVNIDNGLSALGIASTGVGERLTAIRQAVEATAAAQAEAADAIRQQAGAGDRVRSITADIQARMNTLGQAAANATAPLVANTEAAAANVEKAVKAQFSGALEFGSAEARTAILSARVNGEDSAAKEQVGLAKQQVSLQQQAVNELRLLGKAFSFEAVDI
jgi:hypothetical protein